MKCLKALCPKGNFFTKVYLRPDEVLGKTLGIKERGKLFGYNRGDGLLEINLTLDRGNPIFSRPDDSIKLLVSSLVVCLDKSSNIFFRELFYVLYILSYRSKKLEKSTGLGMPIILLEISLKL